MTISAIWPCSTTGINDNPPVRLLKVYKMSFFIPYLISENIPLYTAVYCIVILQQILTWGLVIFLTHLTLVSHVLMLMNIILFQFYIWHRSSEYVRGHVYNVYLPWIITWNKEQFSPLIISPKSHHVTLSTQLIFKIVLYVEISNASSRPVTFFKYADSHSIQQGRNSSLTFFSPLPAWDHYCRSFLVLETIL